MTTRHPPLADHDRHEATSVLSLLSQDLRLRIFEHIVREHPVNVTAICRAVDMDQPAVSHHLALLRVNGLVECARTGKNNFYSPTPHGTRAYSLVRTLANGRS